MAENLEDLFGTTSAPPGDDQERPVFAVLPVPGFESCFVGEDGEGYASLLITTVDAITRPPPPIRLESLDAQFALRCHLRKAREPEQEGVFTVIRKFANITESVCLPVGLRFDITHKLGDSPILNLEGSVMSRSANMGAGLGAGMGTQRAVRSPRVPAPCGQPASPCRPPDGRRAGRWRGSRNGGCGESRPAGYAAGSAG